MKLYQDPSENQKMVLKEKLRTTKMTQEDTVASFFLKIARIRDDILVIDEIVPNK